ncbi:hypothetical protein M011DRAFT_67462 [Sporormia fimetaria CBS 119925]|uniref:Uncharacterized protein n=1 Tax=Sporormia fimetaria CBS 119925 TaxID=1340428 RepID=A0A6A6VC57_9PLEO|nr:hypothetical protein M011DRAFT_67462 [Sporormia fimetaria CBS 119925]
MTASSPQKYGFEQTFRACSSLYYTFWHNTSDRRSYGGTFQYPDSVHACTALPRVSFCQSGSPHRRPRIDTPHSFVIFLCSSHPMGIIIGVHVHCIAYSPSYHDAPRQAVDIRGLASLLYLGFSTSFPHARARSRHDADSRCYDGVFLLSLCSALAVEQV